MSFNGHVNMCVCAFVTSYNSENVHVTDVHGNEAST